MAEHLDLDTFTGPHPTNKEFVAQLQAWGFTQRKTDGVHLVFRAPHGGTVRVLRTLFGRVDGALVRKAARFAQVDEAQFWAGPDAVSTRAAGVGEVTHNQPASRPTSPSRDRVTSLVLAAHAAADRPLGFDQVVQLCPNDVTRAQVRHASSTLCRDGQLHRIRSGVYQWAGGNRALRAVADQSPPASPPAASPVSAPSRVSAPSLVPTSTPPELVPTGHAERASAAELFNQLFPHGVRMTAELLADFEQWTQLTQKLATYARAS